MMELEIRVQNYYKVKQVIEMLSDSGYYRGAFRDTLTDTLRDMHAYAVRIVHRITGYLATSISWDYNSHQMKGQLFLDPSISYFRGRTLQRPSVYGVFEEDRGGDHAFFSRTYRHFEGREVVRDLATRIVRW